MLRLPTMAHVGVALLLLLQRVVLMQMPPATGMHLQAMGKAGMMTCLIAMLSRRGPLSASARYSGTR